MKATRFQENVLIYYMIVLNITIIHSVFDTWLNDYKCLEILVYHATTTEMFL